MGDGDQLSAAAWAQAQLAAVRDEPAGRMALLGVTYRRPSDGARRPLPYRRAALSFMRWEERRGLLRAVDDEHPGSPWWRQINGRLLLDGCEASALAAGRRGEPSSPGVRRWRTFIEQPTATHWWLAHNTSIVGAYLEHRTLAEDEGAAERFFMNVVLLRVLYAHALVGNPGLALGAFAPLGRLLGDPRLGMAGVFLSLQRVLPDRYPLAEHDVGVYLAEENTVGRLMDYAVIGPRLQALYEWSAAALGEPGLLELINDGSPTYAWPHDERHVWTPHRLSCPARALGRALGPRGRRRSAAPTPDGLRAGARARR